MAVGWILASSLTTASPTLAQGSRTSIATALAELTANATRMGHPDTRIRVDALHRVWTIALASPDTDVKLMALDLLREPVGSSSDHIRMPAVFAIAEIANSSGDARVKIRALHSLTEPMNASQVPIRDVAIDAVNSIASSPGIAAAAVTALAPAVRSGNNGVRLPAIDALVRAVVGHEDPAASEVAMDLLLEPLNSDAAIGGMEVRMMAVAAMEKIGVDAANVATKAKALGLLQSYAARDSWEPEARNRAQDAAARVKATIRN